MHRPKPERHGTWIAIGATAAAVGSAIAFGYPAAAGRSGPDWWKHPIVIAGLALLVIGGVVLIAIVIDILVPRRPRAHVRFLKVERGDVVTPLPPLEELRRGTAVLRRFTPVRAVFANSPPEREPGVPANVWARIEYRTGDRVELSIDGRWAGEPQKGESPSNAFLPRTRPDAGYWRFEPDGRPASLDIAVVERGTGWIFAIDSGERWHHLSASTYDVHVVLRAEGMAEVHADFKLSVSMDDEPILEELPS